MYSKPNKARDRKPTVRNEAVTASEYYLKNLCEQSFLSLWSYPGVFRDQGKQGRGDGKEICDMLVVFDEHVIIFSDKYCGFPASGNLEVDWKRWYKRAIGKSAKQAWGAERWLRKHPDRVFLDKACKHQFPLSLPEDDTAQYHLVVVAHGCEERCEDHFGGRGSLMINTVQDSGSLPFTIGDLDANKTFIHVLNDSTLDVVLGTLDTAPDFVNYLERKERLFRSGTEVFAAGEEDLLAFYLKDINEAGEHDFVVPESVNAIALEEGHWEQFCAKPERIAQVKEDEISYLWDTLIERFSKHALDATQYFTTHVELAPTEAALRFMAREPRFHRRMIAKGLIGVFADIPDDSRRIKYLPPTAPDAPFYVFFCLPQPSDMARDRYREVRGGMLEAICMVVKHMHPQTKDIIGIASDPVRPNQGSSEDLIYLDTREWSKEQDDEAARLKEELILFNSVRAYRVNEDEYPTVTNKPVKKRKIGRNERCPCSSGRKYKHCHGRK